MIKTIALILFLAFCFQANASQKFTWGSLATLNPEIIERKATSFILEHSPELKDVELKIAQIDAQLHKKNGPSLEAIYIHSDSVKHVSENKTLGIQDPDYFIPYYMEFIIVEFSNEGEPAKLNYREQLLFKTKEKSIELFKKLYDNI